MVSPLGPRPLPTSRIVQAGHRRRAWGDVDRRAAGSRCDTLVQRPGCQSGRDGETSVQHLGDACRRLAIVEPGIGLARGADDDAGILECQQIVAVERHQHRPARGVGPGQAQVDDLAPLRRHRQRDARGLEQLGAQAPAATTTASAPIDLAADAHARGPVALQDQLRRSAHEPRPTLDGCPVQRGSDPPPIDPRAARHEERRLVGAQRREQGARLDGESLSAWPTGQSAARARTRRSTASSSARIARARRGRRQRA